MFTIIASTVLLLTFSFTNSAVSLAATQGAIGSISESQSSESVKQNDSQKTCTDAHGNIVCSE